MTLARVWIPSPNYSGRGGSKVRLIVVHTAEGARTYQSLGSFFANPASGVSSHTGIDDTPNTVGEYVRPDGKAWTQANANPYSVATELCAFAGWDAAEWNRHPVMLSNCAAWIAEEARRFGIPVQRLTGQQAQSGHAGVCGHADLGAAGGNHWDPGPSFPWADVMRMAAGGASTPAPPEPVATISKGGDPAMATSVAWNGSQHVFSVGPDGKLVQRWDKAGGWGSATLGTGCAPNQSPAADQHSSQLHIYAVRPDSRVLHAWQAKGASKWGTEVLT